MGKVLPMRPLRRTLVFCAHPEPGRVLEGLCPPLTEEQAASLATALLDDLVAELGMEGDLGLALCVDPGERRGWFVERFPGIPVFDQGEGGALERRERACAHLVPGGEGGAARSARAAAPGGSLVIVDSDLVTLTAAEVRRAHSRLEGGARMVIAADSRGALALVGARGPLEGALLEVPASQPDQYPRVLATALERGLSPALLDPLERLATPADLEALRSRQSRSAGPTVSGRRPRTAAFLAGLPPLVRE